jgi:hypothetical protein
MDIAAYTMTLQTNCRDQTFVSIVTFRELQSVFVVVLMFNITINYTTARMDYALFARPSRTPIVIGFGGPSEKKVSPH